jgi:hypothetical protein
VIHRARLCAASRCTRISSSKRAVLWLWVTCGGPRIVLVLKCGREPVQFIPEFAETTRE